MKYKLYATLATVCDTENSMYKAKVPYLKICISQGTILTLKYLETVIVKILLFR
jgi:hypothetical protein